MNEVNNFFKAFAHKNEEAVSNKEIEKLKEELEKEKRLAVNQGNAVNIRRYKKGSAKTIFYEFSNFEKESRFVSVSDSTVAVVGNIQSLSLSFLHPNSIHIKTKDNSDITINLFDKNDKNVFKQWKEWMEKQQKNIDTEQKLKTMMDDFFEELVRKLDFIANDKGFFYNVNTKEATKLEEIRKNIGLNNLAQNVETTLESFKEQLEVAKKNILSNWQQQEKKKQEEAKKKLEEEEEKKKKQKELEELKKKEVEQQLENSLKIPKDYCWFCFSPNKIQLQLKDSKTNESKSLFFPEIKIPCDNDNNIIEIPIVLVPNIAIRFTCDLKTRKMKYRLTDMSGFLKEQYGENNIELTTLLKKKLYELMRYIIEDDESVRECKFVNSLIDHDPIVFNKQDKLHTELKKNIDKKIKNFLSLLSPNNIEKDTEYEESEKKKKKEIKKKQTGVVEKSKNSLAKKNSDNIESENNNDINMCMFILKLEDKRKITFKNNKGEDEEFYIGRDIKIIFSKDADIPSIVLNIYNNNDIRVIQSEHELNNKTKNINGVFDTNIIDIKHFKTKETQELLRLKILKILPEIIGKFTSKENIELELRIRLKSSNDLRTYKMGTWNWEFVESKLKDNKILQTRIKEFLSKNNIGEIKKKDIKSEELEKDKKKDNDDDIVDSSSNSSSLIENKNKHITNIELMQQKRKQKIEKEEIKEKQQHYQKYYNVKFNRSWWSPHSKSNVTYKYYANGKINKDGKDDDNWTIEIVVGNEYITIKDKKGGIIKFILHNRDREIDYMKLEGINDNNRELFFNDIRKFLDILSSKKKYDRNICPGNRTDFIFYSIQDKLIFNIDYIRNTITNMNIKEQLKKQSYKADIVRRLASNISNMAKLSVIGSKISEYIKTNPKLKNMNNDNLNNNKNLSITDENIDSFDITGGTIKQNKSFMNTIKFISKEIEFYDETTGKEISIIDFLKNLEEYKNIDFNGINDNIRQEKFQEFFEKYDWMKSNMQKMRNILNKLNKAKISKKDKYKKKKALDFIDEYIETVKKQIETTKGEVLKKKKVLIDEVLKKKKVLIDITRETKENKTDKINIIEDTVGDFVFYIAGESTHDYTMKMFKSDTNKLCFRSSKYGLLYVSFNDDSDEIESFEYSKDVENKSLLLDQTKQFLKKYLEQIRDKNSIKVINSNINDDKFIKKKEKYEQFFTNLKITSIYQKVFEELGNTQNKNVDNLNSVVKSIEDNNRQFETLKKINNTFKTNLRNKKV